MVAISSIVAESAACCHGQSDVWQQNCFMRMTSDFIVHLSESDRQLLTRRASRARTSLRARLRATIVLDASDGMSNAVIARDLSVCVDTVRKWRRRFSLSCVKGLEDLARSGRPH